MGGIKAYFTFKGERKREREREREGERERAITRGKFVVSNIEQGAVFLAVFF